MHEHMLVDGATGYLQGYLLHEDRRGLEHFIAKHNRYSTLEAAGAFFIAHTLAGCESTIFRSHGAAAVSEYADFTEPSSPVVFEVSVHVCFSGRFHGSSGGVEPLPYHCHV